MKMAEKGYICDFCNREIPGDRYDAHRTVCGGQSFPPVSMEMFSIQGFFDMPKLPAREFLNLRQLLEVGA
jgi:hypothetical protein